MVMRERVRDDLSRSAGRSRARATAMSGNGGRSNVLTGCAVILIALWTSNAVLYAWRLEIGRNSGASMLPTLGDGAVYLTQVRPLDVRVGDIVEACVVVDGQIDRVVKRVRELSDGNIRLEGDNMINTWKGWVPISAVEGKVVAVLWRGRKSAPDSYVLRPSSRPNLRITRD